jgi:hypothetical protein
VSALCPFWSNALGLCPLSVSSSRLGPMYNCRMTAKSKDWLVAPYAVINQTVVANPEPLPGEEFETKEEAEQRTRKLKEQYPGVLYMVVKR